MLLVSLVWKSLEAQHSPKAGGGEERQGLRKVLESHPEEAAAFLLHPSPALLPACPGTGSLAQRRCWHHPYLGQVFAAGPGHIEPGVVTRGSPAFPGALLCSKIKGIFSPHLYLRGWFKPFRASGSGSACEGLMQASLLFSLGHSSHSPVFPRRVFFFLFLVPALNSFSSSRNTNDATSLR